MLDTQRADTARLRTLLHMDHVGGARSEADFDTLYKEQVQLVRRLRRPEAHAFQLDYADYQLSKAKADPATRLKSQQATIEAFDSVGRPVPHLLFGVAQLF